MAFKIFKHCCPCGVLEDACDDCCKGMPSGDTVVSISKEEYISYMAGGSWSLSSSISFSESYSDGGSGSMSGSGSTSGDGEMAECEGSASATGDGNASYHFVPEEGEPYDTEDEFGVSASIHVSLGYEDGSYYLGITVFGHITRSGTGGTGYGTGTATIDGHDVPMVSTWSPGWAGYDGYTNGSTETITATFTPAAP